MYKKIKVAIFVYFGFYLVGSLVQAKRIIDRGEAEDSIFQYLAISVTAVLFLVIWLKVLKLYFQSKSYAQKIKKSREFSAFNSISSAAVFLLISLITTSLINLIRIPPPDGTYQILTLSLYYSAGLLAVVFLFYFGNAGRELAFYVKQRLQYVLMFIFFALSVVIGTIFAWIHISGIFYFPENHIMHYVPKWFILYTLYMPLAFGWVYALSGAYGIYLFQQNAKGLIYKKSMIYLSIGLVVFIVVSVARHASDYIVGSASQATIVDDFFRVLALLLTVITAISLMSKGLSKLTKIEDTNLD